MQLPYAYVSRAGFSRSFLKICIESAPLPQDCTVVGAAESSLGGMWGGVPASATVVVGPPSIQYPQGEEEACAVCCVASALHHWGETAAASMIFGLKACSLQLPRGESRVEWLKLKCSMLQPAVQRRKFTSLELLNVPALLEFLQSASGVVVMQIRDSSRFIGHCIAAVDGWLFDPNKPHALQLSAKSLDDCCLRDATFVSVVKGFRLEHLPPLIEQPHMAPGGRKKGRKRPRGGGDD
jgi:hypothetical protein